MPARPTTGHAAAVRATPAHSLTRMPACPHTYARTCTRAYARASGMGGEGGRAEGRTGVTRRAESPGIVQTGAVAKLFFHGFEPGMPGFGGHRGGRFGSKLGNWG